MLSHLEQQTHWTWKQNSLSDGPQACFLWALHQRSQSDDTEAHERGVFYHWRVSQNFTCKKNCFTVCLYSPWVSPQCRKHGFDPWIERSPGERAGNPLQYSCLRNPMHRGTWWTILHAVTKWWTWLSDWAHTCTLGRNIISHYWTYCLWSGSLEADLEMRIPVQEIHE